MADLSFGRQRVPLIMGGSTTATICPRSCQSPKLGEQTVLTSDGRPFAWATVRSVVFFRRSEAAS